MKFRNLSSLYLIDTFLVTAAVSMITVRFMLHLFGYPAIGGAHFHIAHMLWGGLLMLLAMLVSVFYIGPGVTRLVMILGGAGFGLFIDELGKFITRDNNYFYQPAIGIIYLIFVAVYIGSRLLVKRLQYRPVDYKASALRLVESALDGKLTSVESSELTRMMQHTDDPAFNKMLTSFVADFSVVEQVNPSWLRRISYRMDEQYHRFFDAPAMTRTIRLISIALVTILIVLQFLLVIYGAAIAEWHEAANS